MSRFQRTLLWEVEREQSKLKQKQHPQKAKRCLRVHLWTAHFDETHQRPYWANTQKHAIVWTMPPGLAPVITREDAVHVALGCDSDVALGKTTHSV